MPVCVYVYVYTQVETAVFVSVNYFLTHESKVKLLLPEICSINIYYYCLLL